MILDRKVAPEYTIPLNFDIKLLPLTKINLKNNAPVYYLQNNEMEVVEIDFVFKAGSIYDHQKLIASFTNSLIKTGTKKKSSAELASYFEQYGAFVETSCGVEYAEIGVKILFKHIDKILPLLRELFTEANFIDKELNTFTTRISKFLELRLQKNDYVADTKINALIFGINHPYSISPNVKDYEEIKSEPLRSFYNQFYVQGECVIFIAGKVNDTLFELLNQCFGDLPWQPNLSPLAYSTIAPLKNDCEHISNNKTSVQSSIRMATILEGTMHEDFLKLKFLNVLLGGYFGSRLMKTIREKKGYTYGIHSYIQNNAKECAWIIATETGIQYNNIIIKAIYNEFSKLKKQIVADDELQRVKNFYLGMILSQTDSVFSSMGIWKNLVLKNMEVERFALNIKTIKNISAEELTILANKYLNKKNFIELIVN